MIAAALGTADCERVGSGALAQPVNALSSLAFCVVGLWIVARAFRAERGRRAELGVFGAAVFANGVGSFALHGPQPGWSRWAHDAAIVAVLLFAGVHALTSLAGWPVRDRLALFVAILAFAVTTIAATPDASYAWFLVAGIVGGAGEVAAVRAGYRPWPIRGRDARTLAWLLAVSAFVVGAVAFFLGRSDSPVCDPGTLLQGHGLWHVLQALAMGGYAFAAIELWSGPDEMMSRDGGGEGVSSATGRT